MKIIKSFLLYGLATSIQKLVGFILLPVYTSQFNVVEFGVLEMLGTLSSIVAIFGMFQLDNSLQRYFYDDAGIERDVLVTNIFIIVTVCSIAFGMLLSASSHYLSRSLFDTDEYSNLIRLSAIQIPLNNVFTLGLVLLRFQKMDKAFLLAIIVNVAATILLLYLFVIRLEYHLYGVMIAQIAALLVSVALILFTNRRFFNRTWSNIVCIKSLRFALPMFPARIGSIVLSHANRFIIISFLGIGALGVFSFALKIGSIVQLANTAFILAWSPFMYSQFKNKKNRNVFQSVFPVVVSATLLFVILVTLYSKDLIQMISNEEYHDSYKFVGGIALYYSLLVIKEVVDIGPKITEQTKHISINFLLAILVNLITMYALVNYLQLDGIVLSLVATNIFLVLRSWYVSNRLYHIPYGVVKFALLLVPAVVIATLTMYFDMSILMRSFVALVMSIYYGLFLLHSIKGFRLATKDSQTNYAL